MTLTDEVRASCERIAAGAEHVRIDPEALGEVRPGPAPGLHPEFHYLEGEPGDVADYLLALDAINFGSGWFPTLRKRTHEGSTVSGYFTVAWGLADHVRTHGPPTGEWLRAVGTREIAEILGQPPHHELMSLYAQALRELGRFLGDRRTLDLVEQAGGAADGQAGGSAEGQAGGSADGQAGGPGNGQAGGPQAGGPGNRQAGESAENLAQMLADGMAMFDDRGFYKRAQIVPNDLALAGVARFADLDRLTIFADNLVPHVLRCEGVLSYDDELSALIDSGRGLPMGRAEREIRACALHACELISKRTGIPPRQLDTWLWTQGQQPRYKQLPRHRCRNVFY